MFKKVPFIIALLIFMLGTSAYASSINTHTSFVSTITLAESTTQQTKVAPAQGEEKVASADLNTKDTENVSTTPYIMIGSVTAILIFAFGSYWLLLRKKYVKRKT